MSRPGGAGSPRRSLVFLRLDKWLALVEAFLLSSLPHDLLIFGASCRAAAFSALRCGLRPHCADYFGDRDLAAVCSAERIDPDMPLASFIARSRIASSFALVLYRRVRESSRMGGSYRAQASALGR